MEDYKMPIRKDIDLGSGNVKDWKLGIIFSERPMTKEEYLKLYKKIPKGLYFYSKD